jgi:protein disulfide-isomerase
MTALICALMLAASSTPVGFTDNLPKALESAKANGKNVFMVCSGSDWCGWCMRLEQEVLSSQIFREKMSGYELVFIDMPQDKTILSDWAREHNQAVCEEYKVHGFPSCFILDADGKVISRLGYEKGGAENYVKTIDYLKANQADIDKYIMPIAAKFDALIPKLNKLYKQKFGGGMAAVKKFGKPKVEALLKEIDELEVPEAIAQEKVKLREYAQELYDTLK